MISRKTRARDYKEKKPITAFGRVILPLSVLMALALLYFSVRLFFFAPSVTAKATDPGKDLAERAVLSADDTASATAAETEGGGEDEEILPAAKAEEQKPAKAASAPKKAAAQKTAPKPKPAQRSAQKPVKQNETYPRWDIQIGGFSAKDGADLTVQQARSAGYSVYIENSVLNSKPFYKVRVRGSSDKTKSAEMSKNLERAGFPVYLVEIKR